MLKCRVCDEKESEIRTLKADKKTILGITAKDKKIYRAIILVEGVVLLLVTAFGKEGIKMAMDLVKEIIK
jgi:hypothetical protein